MTALAQNRDTRELAGKNPVAAFTIYNAEIMYAGGMAAVDYLGEIQMAANTAGLKVVGCVTRYTDNTADGKTATVERGIYRFANSSSYPITRSAIGTVCYVEDDNIVAGYASAMVPAGLVFDVDADGVWVDMSAAALAVARQLQSDLQVDKTDDYTCTAALAYEGRTFFSCAKTTALMHITFPSAVAGMRIGVCRAAAAAGKDVGVTAGAGDTIEAYDGTCAAGKSVETTVDAVSQKVWWIAVDATHWVLDRRVLPIDIAGWVKNDA
jgi:hypothetical protein